MKRHRALTALLCASLELRHALSHLRFGPKPIRAPYLIELNQANFVACHQFSFLERVDMLKYAKTGATFLLNTPHGKDAVWDTLPLEVQQAIVEKQLKFYVIDGYKVAEETGMGGRVNTIMQTCFFAIRTGTAPARWPRRSCGAARRTATAAARRTDRRSPSAGSRTRT